jgi:type IV pilus assembly protein PilM
MAVQPGVWGIDIGACALKAVRLQLINGQVTATAFDYVEHPKILTQPDADPDQLTRDALEKFLSRNPVKGDKVAVGVPGQSGLARFVKLPPVEEKKIDDIVKFEAKQQIPFPLDEVVWDYQKVSEGTVEGGFAIDTEIGLFAMKRDMINRYLNHFQGVNVEVHFIQMSPLALCNYITFDVLQKGGEAPAAPGADPAAAPAAAPAPVPVLGGKKKCVVALDIGTDGSNLIITDGGKVIWQRPIPIGGNHFTRALTKELKLTFAKAEHLKRNAAKSPELANILKALKPVLTDFVGEVQRSLGYFTNTHRDAQVEYLVGLGSAFKLPGLQKYLGDKLQIRVEKPTKFHRLGGEAVTGAPAFAEHVLTFPVAYGLALQGLGSARLRTNLLPPEITWDRKIRAKKPWAVAAAALLMAGTGVLAYGYSVPYASVNDPTISKSLEKGKQAADQAQQVEKEIADAKGQQDKAMESVQAIIAGKDERENWVRINDYINASLPMPPQPRFWSLLDPMNQARLADYQSGRKAPEPGMGNLLLRPDLIPLWFSSDKDATGASPLLATTKYFDRIKKGVDERLAVLDDDMRQYLATVDVEAIYCRYTTNPEGFFKEAKRFSKKYVGADDAIFTGLDDPERAEIMAETPKVMGTVFGKDGRPVFKDGKPEREPIKDGAWIFEVRGTTWYDHGTIKGREFLRTTVLEFLKQNARPDANNKEKSPVRGRVSHVFLYNTWPDENPRPGVYHWIDASLIDELMPKDAASEGTSTGTGTVPTSGPPMPAGGPPMSSGDTPGVRGQGAGSGAWRPLSTGTATSAAASGSGFGTMSTTGSESGGGSGRYQRSSSAPAGGATTGTPMVGTAIGGKEEPKEKEKAVKPKPRYEFIIVFVWREPTPSDRFIKKEPGVAAPAPGQGGYQSAGPRGTPPGSPMGPMSR